MYSTALVQASAAPPPSVLKRVERYDAPQGGISQCNGPAMMHKQQSRQGRQQGFEESWSDRCQSVVGCLGPPNPSLGSMWLWCHRPPEGIDSVAGSAALSLGSRQGDNKFRVASSLPVCARLADVATGQHGRNLSGRTEDCSATMLAILSVPV